MEEVLDEYKQVYDANHPRVCLDESPKQLVSETRQIYIDAKGVEHVDFEYKREGAADMYMIVEPLGGRREVLIKDSHDRINWAQAITHICEQMYPQVEQITLIQDNLSAHKKSALYEIHAPEKARQILKRLRFIFTPKHGSWLNIAECELSVLARQGVKQRVANKAALEKQVSQWYEQRNLKQCKVDWQFTTKKARVKLKRLYPIIIT